jgi:hypothetical protein
MIIRQEGIDPKRINNMKMVKVFDGTPPTWKKVYRPHTKRLD